MNRGTLPILARLHSLQTAARLRSGRARVIAEQSDRNPVAQVLRAANETVLGRSLQFESAAGPSLTLDVAGRRVLRVTAAQGIAATESCLDIETLEDEHKDAVIKLLQAVAVPRHELRVISGPIGRGGEGVSVGLPVALLADLLLIELNEFGAPEPEAEDVPPPVQDVPVDDAPELTGDRLRLFAEQLGSVLTAWLLAGGESDGRTEGPEEMLSHLQGFLDDERETLDRQMDMIAAEAGGPVCVILGVTLVEGHSILCARSDTTLLLGVIEGDGTQIALGAWKAALR